MKVIKFGGTSVGKTHTIEQICYILRDKKKQEDRYAIIVSAIGGITDNLVNCAQYAAKKNVKYHLILDEIEIKHLEIIRELFPLFQKKNLISRIIKFIKYLEHFYDSISTITYFSRKSLDKIMNFGELISSYIINEKLNESGFFSIWKDSRELIVIENQYESVQVNFTKSILHIKDFFLKENTPYILLPGFIASSNEYETATLGRGGSDYSASIFSAALQAEKIEIWTDVSGVLTANPKIVSKAFTQEKISFIEAIELSHYGAKVIYPPTLLPSMKNKIPLAIKNTFSPLERGTLIIANCKDKGDKNLIIGITGMQNITLLKKLCVYGDFKSERCIEEQILKEFTNNTISVDEELCLIVVVANDIKKISVTLSHMFKALGRKNINLRFFLSTEKNIYSIIAKKDFKKSIKTLHEIFFERPYKKIHIFIAGLGKVGHKLIEQLHKQKEYLVEELHVKIKVIGICNSKIMYFDFQEKGINLNNFQDNLKLGTSMTIEEFLSDLYYLKNNIFIDTTDSKEIANIYYDILGKGIGVVTCNKIACTSSYQEYKNVKSFASYFKTPLFFETNVGSSLPVISTLNNLVESGDKIHLIYAVLSGSLNFIFNKCKGTFTEILMEAKKRSFTEPDPRIDLSCVDAIRKIIILIRECGESIELEDVKQISLTPKRCVKTLTVDSFYQELFSNEEFFIQLHTIAKEQRKRIRFITKYKYGEAYAGLEYIEFEHPFYKLDCKDNIISYNTVRYADQPLFVKGAGAGAEITASGVFSDIIKASR